MKQIHDGTVHGSLAHVDLNLFVAFDALVRERSVTRAAQRVGVTQSAMSHALQRLRRLVGDPLLVRGQGGMALTPRAESLAIPTQSALSTMSRALAHPTPFEPASAQRPFCIASPDLFDVLVLPGLLKRVREEAPGVDVAVTPLGLRLSSQLEIGEVDVAIVPEVEDLRSSTAKSSAPGLLRKTLFHDEFVCLLRAGHPAIVATKKRGVNAGMAALSLEQFASLPHALVSPTGAGPGLVDRALEGSGLERRIALRIPNFYSALAIVAQSDLVLTAPSPLARLAPREMRIVAMKPPLRLPRHDIHLVWHERFSNDPAHRWFRDVVTAVARAAMA